MEYNILVDAELEKEIEITVPPNALDPFIDEEVSELQKKLAVKGFRKGRVPKNLIKSRYRDTIKVQAVNHIVTQSYIKILEEKKWRPATTPKLLSFDEGENIKFRMHFEVIPAFEVDNYTNLELFKGELIPDNILLEQGLKDLREQYATVKEVTRPAVVDDFVSIDLEIIEKGKVKSKQNDVLVKIGDRNLPDEINRALVGKRKTDNDEIMIGDLGDLIHKITIKKIEEKELPQIDDAFVKSLNYGDVEQFKQKFMEDLKKAEERRIEEELKESLSKVILERIRFNVPKSLVQDEYEKILQRSQLPDSDTNKERFWDISEKRVRFNLILARIAEKENIKVTEEEVMNVISNTGIKLDDENREDIIVYVSNILNREKTIDFLYKNAKINEKNRIISPKEVRK